MERQRFWEILWINLMNYNDVLVASMKKNSSKTELLLQSRYSAFHLVLPKIPPDRILHLYNTYYTYVKITVLVPFGPQKLLKSVDIDSRRNSSTSGCYLDAINGAIFGRTR